MTGGRKLLAWLRNVLIGLDQLGNAALRGNPDETISSRVGRAELAEKSWGVVCAWIIDGLFALLGEAPGHCRREIEWDEVA